MSTRRHPPVPGVIESVHLPEGKTPDSFEGQVVRALQNISAELVKISRGVKHSYDSVPGRHAETHLVEGADPLQTAGTPVTVKSDAATADAGDGPSYMREDAQLIASTATPTNATGTAHAQGSAQTLMRSDATIKQGIVTTKGDLLTFAAVPARQAVGADNSILEAASGQTNGLLWSTLATILGRMLTTTGDLVYRAAGGVTRLAASGVGFVLFSNGTGEEPEYAHPATAWLYAELTDGVDANFFNIDTVGAGVSVAQTVTYQVRVIVSGSVKQYEIGTITLHGRNEAGTPTVTITAPTVLASYAESGTLVVTFPAVGVASNVVTVKINADTSLSPTLMEAVGVHTAKCDDTVLDYLY
jgi:hypothetical protein